jgi:hypothetical protein
VGAVNQLAGQPVWTQQTFFHAWEKAGRPGGPSPDFGTFAPIAVGPVGAKISFLARDGKPPLENVDYLKLIDDCLRDGGIAILSMENASVATGVLRRGGTWHMLTIFGGTGTTYETWDTMGAGRQVTALQLLTYVDYGSAVLAMHDNHDLLLLTPVP